MNDDYLWDRNGAADPDVVRLERVLGTLRDNGGGEPRWRQPDRPRRAIVGLAPLATLAATVVLLIGLSWYESRLGPAFQVTPLEGTPTVASRPVTAEAELKAGSWLETDGQARATIDVAGVGRLQIEPDTRVGLVANRSNAQRLELERGTLHALIWSPPGQFAVATPSSTAIDLGCAYTLSVDDQGIGLVRVTTGWVGFEWNGRESFIPAGAACRTHPGLGPGTPYFEDASPALQAAIEEIDTGRGTTEGRSAALARALAESSERDTVTLWHLLTRADRDDRGSVFDRLAGFVPPPPGVTRQGVIAGQRDMLDAWWDALGFGGTNWWRVWKQQWRSGPGR